MTWSRQSPAEVTTPTVMRDRAWVTVHAVLAAQDAARAAGNQPLVKLLASAIDLAVEGAADAVIAVQVQDTITAEARRFA